MKKKLLAILGSPHENGSTAAMLQYALKIATAQGWEVTTVQQYEKQILFCKGCRACTKTAQCVLKETSTFPRPQLSKEQEYLLMTACNTPPPLFVALRTKQWSAPCNE